jgi:tetratricopeptide (TPR) repeat protein
MSPMTRQSRARRRIVALFLALACAVPAIAQTGESAAVRTRAFDLAYNLDRQEAAALLRSAVASDPGDPALHRALASVIWLQILFQRGAVTVDHYLGSFSRTQVQLKSPPAELDSEFRTHAARAIELAEARVRAAPDSAQAHYDLGAAVGLRASHTASVEGRLFAGFKAARRAYHAHERVLELDPSRKDAGLVVGLYRYLVSTLSAPMRMMAYVAGFGGGRERGIRLIEETAAAGGEARVDAMFALILIYNRERRYDDALRILTDLRRAYPRNRLIVLEYGSTALRAGRAAEAEGLLTEGLAMLAAEKRPLFAGEEALWRYKRGAARVAAGRHDAAHADLSAAAGGSAQDWVSGRAHAQLARIAAARGNPAEARRLAERAESLCTQGSDPACVQDARTLRRNTSGG